MKGITPAGEIIELTPLQADLVNDVRRWARSDSILALPHIGRQGGKSVILSTVAEYDKRGWPKDLA